MLRGPPGSPFLCGILNDFDVGQKLLVQQYAKSVLIGKLFFELFDMYGFVRCVFVTGMGGKAAV